MKSRAVMIFFISAIVTLIAFPATSRAVTFPITYEGTVHVTAYFPYVSGGCGGDANMTITLNKNGTLTGTEDFIVSTPGPNKTACEIISDKRMGFQGTYNEAAGKFDAKIAQVPVTGTFDDVKITGSGAASRSDGMDLTFSFTLPKSYNCAKDKKIPLPVGPQSFINKAPASPVVGVVPSLIKPLGLGEIVNDKTSSSSRVQFCSFEGPVDIYLIYGDAAMQLYVLGSDGTVKGAENFQAWKTGVTGPVDETIDSSFGGLFPDPGRLPKGTNTFYVAVAPSGNAPSGVYIWGLSVDTSCEEIHAGYPYGPNFFLHEPIAVPVYSSDPAKMKPLALGPVAVGGETITMYSDFCSFGGSVNLYFGLFCNDDLENLYLLNCSGKEDCKPAAKNEILEKVPLASFAGFSKPFTFSIPENLESQPQAFFSGSSQDLPNGQCIYFVAVTAEDEPQPATKFYMWGTMVEFNIRNALIDFWWNNLHPAAVARTEAFHKKIIEKMTTLIQNKK